MRVVLTAEGCALRARARTVPPQVACAAFPREERGDLRPLVRALSPVRDRLPAP